MSRNKREGHYWCKGQGKYLRFPSEARYIYKKQKTIKQHIVYDSRPLTECSPESIKYIILSKENPDG